MSLKCPKGHTQGFERVPVPGESVDMMLCRQCRTEAVFYSVPCVCGHREYTFRPVTGKYSPWTTPVYIQCRKCGRYQSSDLRHPSTLLAPLLFSIRVGSGPIAGWYTGQALWSYDTFSELSTNARLAISIGVGVVVCLLVAFLVIKITRRFFNRNREG
jgi:hypothetical protein